MVGRQLAFQIVDVDTPFLEFCITDNIFVQRRVGAFATQACDAGLRAGALFVQDLVNEATQDDDGPVEAFRFISDTGLMTALP